MPTLLVTSVGAIGSASYGWLSIKNTLTYALAHGYSATLFGRQYVAPDIPARMLALDLAKYPFGLNFAFGWEGQLLVSKGESQQHFGYCRVDTDQYTAPVGLNTTLYGRSFVSPYLPYLFEFSEARPNEVNNLHLPLSGGAIFLPKGQDSLELGYARAATVQLCFTEGWETFETFRSWVLPSPYLLTFDLLAYPRPEVRFTFSGADIVNASLNIDILRFGVATVATDQLATNEGLNATLYGRAFFSNRVRQTFEFVRSTYYSGANIPFAWGGNRAFSPIGLDSLLFPAFQVGGNLGYAAPFGWRSTQLSSFTITLKSLGIAVRWSDYTRYGSATVYNVLHRITLIPDRPQTQWVESPFTIHYPLKTSIKLTGAFSFSIGTPAISHFYAWVYLHNPHAGGYVGTPKVIYKSRTVVMSWAMTLNTGNFSVIRYYDVRVESVPYYSKFGVPHLEFGNVALPVGQTHTIIPNSTVWFYRRPVYSTGFTNSYYGVTEIFNSRQIVQFEYIEGNYDTLTHFGEGSWIFTRNRVLNLQGLESFQLAPIPLAIWNKARPLLPSSITNLIWGKDSFIAAKERILYLQGWESFINNRWNNTVHNAALLIQCTAFGIPTYGQPFVWSNLQAIKQHTGATPDWGTAFVAYAVREIQILGWVKPPIVVGQPQISNRERFLEVTGEDYLRVTPPIFAGPFRRGFTPRWQVQTVVNAPARVWNFNPQAWIPGRPYTEWSYPLAWVSHSPRTLLPETFGNTAIGRHWIRDSKQTVYGKGIWTWVCERFTRVRNQDPDPPSTQIISFVPSSLDDLDNLDDFSIDTLIVSPTFSVSSHAVILGNYEATLYGDTFVRTNVVYIQEYYQKLEFGSFQAVGTRYVLHIQEEESSEYGKPRLSPYTIWAWHSPPKQAVDNHPGPPFDDFFPLVLGSYIGGFPWFGGTTSISSTLRTLVIKEPPALLQVSKDFEVLLKCRYLEMSAIRPPAVPQPTLIPHTKHLRVSGFSTWGSEEFDVVSIDRYPKLISGGLLLKTGTPRIELWSREVTPRAIYGLHWGTNSPMIYHYPRNFSPEGAVLDEYGLAYIDYKNRKVTATGFSATQWDYTEFKDRMTIYGGRYDLSKANNFRVFPIGWSSMETGQSGTPPHEISVGMYTVGQGCVSCRLEVANGGA